jgi:hypothetical protein
LLACLAACATACTPFKKPNGSHGGDGGTGGAGGASGSVGSTLVRPGFETLAPAATAGGAIRLSQQRLSAGSSVTCNGGICFSGGIEP